ncbi:UIT1 family transporter [Desulfitobacterium sp. LBE]|uniref:Dicarboxylate carrier MatC domain protein n=1 Tax=Desulfitobacterium hafniense TaxID=49338 RepID=A0A098B0G2_DESHA|nr:MULTISPECIES: SLC13 family permease [Desulfitobacterium]TWH60775.1 UIT1 family transporter [Desulfitobacterium sp. LBE]CDX02358.1 Dicarboxylate carrier MatC domain protein [Desulfitobacterium hafniense]
MVTSIPSISLLLGAFFVAAIVIAFVKKVNIGVLGLAFAVLLGLLTDLKWKDLPGAFPTTVVLTIFSVTLFFGFFAENGTIQYLANKFLWKFRNTPKLIPFAFYLLGILLAALGGCDMVVFTAAVAFPVGKSIGMKGQHVGVCAMLGSMAGSFLPWSLHGSTAKAIIETMNDGKWAHVANTISWGTFFSAFAIYLVIILIYYFVFKGHKLSGQAEMEEPAAATLIQKKSLVIILGAFFLIVVVPVLTKMIGGSFLTTINRFSSVAPVCIVGAVVNMLMNIGDDKAVLKKRIPWNTLAMLWGMGILLGLGATLGVNKYLGELAEHIPTGMVLVSFLLIAGGLSLFSSSLSVVYPLLLPIAGVVAPNLGLNPVAIMAAIIIGSATTAMSPLSTAGGLLLSSCPDEVYDNSMMFNNMFIMAVITMALLAVAGAVGMIGLWGTLHL